MSQSPPPEPPREREPLGFDDFIGILVALSSIGAILLWSFSQSEGGFDLSRLQFLSPAPRPTASPTPTLEDRFTSAIPIPYSSPSPSPQPTILESPKPSPSAPPVVPVPVPYQPAPSPSPSDETGFSDVPPGYWARPFIAVLAQRRIIEGFPDKTFRPEQPVTRAEFANMLNKAFKQSENQPSLQFKDIRSGYWANLAIDQVVQMGFMKGYPGNIFRPNEEISRTESLVSLANGINLPQASSPEQVVSFYRDTEQIPRYAIDEVAAATNAGLVVNHPDAQILNPQQVTNRAEAAALIYQALVQSGQAEKISSPYIVQP